MNDMTNGWGMLGPLAILGIICFHIIMALCVLQHRMNKGTRLYGFGGFVWALVVLFSGVIGFSLYIVATSGFLSRDDKQIDIEDGN